MGQIVESQSSCSKTNWKRKIRFSSQDRMNFYTNSAVAMDRLAARWHIIAVRKPDFKCFGNLLDSTRSIRWSLSGLLTQEALQELFAPNESNRTAANRQGTKYSLCLGLMSFNFKFNKMQNRNQSYLKSVLFLSSLSLSDES